MRRPAAARASLLILGLIGAALLYGDGAITPAISVLSAVEGLKVDAPRLAPAVMPLTVIDPDRAVPRATERGRVHRRHLRPGDAALVCRARDPWHWRDHPSPGVLAAASPLYAGELSATCATDGQLCRPRRGVPGRDRRRSDVCRHGSFRPRPDPPGLVRGRAAQSRAELSRPGRLAAHQPRCTREPLLPAGTRLGPLRSGRVRDPGHGDRLPGDHLRRVLADPASRSSWASCRTCTSSIPPATSAARSTCRSSTGRSAW